MEKLAEAMDSIAQSFREYVELYRGNSNREAAKGRRPSVVSVTTATYQRENDKQQDVPGFRISGKIPEKNTGSK